LGHAVCARVREALAPLLAIIEQDHRAIKQRYAPMKGFKSFVNSAITIAGIELAQRIHKHQFSFGQGRPRSERSLCTDWQRALAK
jgi:transposase-like protein